MNLRNKLQKSKNQSNEERISQLEDIISEHQYGDRHLDAVTEIGELLGVQTGRNSSKCTLSVKYYRYPNKPMPWRNINVFTSMYDASHIMLGCLQGSSGNEEIYCEAVMITKDGNRLPGVSNKKETGFEDGRIHWKRL